MGHGDDLRITPSLHIWTPSQRLRCLFGWQILRKGQDELPDCIEKIIRKISSCLMRKCVDYT